MLLFIIYCISYTNCTVKGNCGHRQTPNADGYFLNNAPETPNKYEGGDYSLTRTGINFHQTRSIYFHCCIRKITLRSYKMASYLQKRRSELSHPINKRHVRTKHRKGAEHHLGSPSFTALHSWLSSLVVFRSMTCIIRWQIINGGVSASSGLAHSRGQRGKPWITFNRG